MNKLMFRGMYSLAVSLVLASAVFAAKPGKSKQSHSPSRANAHRERVTFEILGAESDQSAQTLNKALAENGLRTAIQESKGKPYRMLADVNGSQDLAKWSKAVITADTPQKEQSPPAFYLVIYAPLTKESAQQALIRLQQLKGIDTKRSMADVKGGELKVRLNGDDRVSAIVILNVIRSAGVAAQFVPMSSDPQK